MVASRVFWRCCKSLDNGPARSHRSGMLVLRKAVEHMKRSPLQRHTPLKASTKPRRSSRPKMTVMRKSAKDEGCTLNVAGVCTYNSETVVLVHLRWLGDCGGSLKPTDLQAVYACSECNRWTDSPTARQRNDSYESDRNFYAIRALVRTQQRMVAKGIIIIKGEAA